MTLTFAFLDRSHSAWWGLDWNHGMIGIGNSEKVFYAIEYSARNAARDFNLARRDTR